MNKNDRIESLCERILSKLKVELNSDPYLLINVRELKEKVSQRIESEDNENSVFDILYTLFYVSALNSLSSDILSDDSFAEQSINHRVNNNPGKMTLDVLDNQMLNEELLSIHEDAAPSLYSVIGNQPNSSTIDSSKCDVPPTNGESNLCLIEISDIICNLLPNTNRSSIEKKLRKYNYEGYKAVLLQDCITKALEDGYDVPEQVFQKLEEWLDSPDTHKSTKHHKSKVNHKKKTLNHSCTAKIKSRKHAHYARAMNYDVNEYGENSGASLNSVPIVPNSLSENAKERIKFLREIVPNLREKKLTKVLSQCSSIEEEDQVISRYLDRNILTPSHENNSDNNSSYMSKNLEDETLQISSSPYKIDHDSDDNDKGCMIVDVVKNNNPLLIELEEGESSPGSVGSDILLVEEVPPKSTIETNESGPEPGPESEPIKSPVQVNEVSTYFENENETEENEAAFVEDIDADAAPWNEAHSICKLLPFFQLNNIHQSLMDNYYDPQRKAKVLTDYIEMALEEGHEIHTEVFEMLSIWQMNRKRHSSNYLEDQNLGYFKRQKQTSDELPQEEYHPIPQPSTSTSHDIPNIPIEQPLPSTELFTQNAPLEAQTLFESLPEETKSWYLKKVEFLCEITNLSKKYILSQILHCQTESDVMHVTTRLLEEQTRNILQQNPPEGNADMLLPSVSGAAAEAAGAENTAVELENTEARNNSEPNESDPSTSANEDANGNQNSAADIEDRIQAHIQQLGEMFSDADPDFISERANEIAGEHEKFVELVVELTENRTYPKMEEYLKRQQKMNMRKKFIEGMSVEEFMEYFEDPEKVFCDTTKEMNRMYVTNARTQLMNDLPFHLSKRIDSVYRMNNFHYLPTLRTLRDEKGARKTKRKVGGKQPGDLDDIFLKELCYAKMEDKIKEHYRNKKKEKQRAFERAKEAGELLECQCCFDDEILQINMSSCENLDNLHFFCNNCIKRYAEEQIGQGKLEFVCLQGECKLPFSLNTLKRLLKPSIFSNLLKRKQAEEIAAAGIEDLESCPFCNFATIMPNKEDKVFKCLNPECLKDSCRLCKELNHIPLRCQEVEKKKQTDARTFLENEMSEAMVRECYKCKKRFIKEEGCNKMVCSCGAMMCYLCKQPIKGYDHFASDSRTTVKTNEDKCPLWSNSLQLHAEEVQQRAAEAKQKLGPDLDLLHDPTKDMPQVPDYLKNPRPNPTLDRGAIPGPRVNALQIQIQRLQNWDDQGRNFHFPNLRMMAANLMVMDDERVQRHTHQHRHQHFYFPPPMIPPVHAHLPPPPPAHHPPPPPAHQHPQQRPPYPPFVDDLNRGHQFRDPFGPHRPQPPPHPVGRLLYPNVPNPPPRHYPPIQQVLAPPPRPHAPAPPPQPPHYQHLNNPDFIHHRQRNHNNQRQNHNHHHNHHHHHHHHHNNNNNNHNRNNNDGNNMPHASNIHQGNNNPFNF